MEEGILTYTEINCYLCSKKIMDLIEHRFECFSISFLGLFLVNIYGFVSLSSELPKWIIPLLFILSELYFIIIETKHYNKMSSFENDDQSFALANLREKYIMILFWITLSYFLYSKHYYFSFITLIWFISILFRVFTLDNIVEDFNSCYSLFGSLVRYLGFLQTTFLTMKIDNFLQIDWLYIFFPLTFLLLVLIFLSLAAFTLFIISFVEKIVKNNSISDTLITLYLTVSLSGITLSLIMFLIGVIGFLNHNNIDKFQELLIFPVIFIPIISISTLGLSTKISIWYIRLFSYKKVREYINSLNSQLNSIRNQEILGNNQNDQSENKPKINLLQGPIQKTSFLIKLSQSYVQRVNDFTNFLRNWKQSKNNLASDPTEKIGKIERNDKNDKIDKMDKINTSIKDNPEIGYISDRVSSNFKVENYSFNKNPKDNSGRISLDVPHKMDQLTGRITNINSKKTNDVYKPLCSICNDNYSNAVLMDCGHSSICFDCGIKIMNTSGECHLCREKIIQILKVEPLVQNSQILKVLDSTDWHKKKNEDLGETSIKIKE